MPLCSRVCAIYSPILQRLSRLWLFILRRTVKMSDFWRLSATNNKWRWLVWTVGDRRRSKSVCLVWDLAWSDERWNQCHSNISHRLWTRKTHSMSHRPRLSTENSTNTENASCRCYLISFKIRSVLWVAWNRACMSENKRFYFRDFSDSDRELWRYDLDLRTFT